MKNGNQIWRRFLSWPGWTGWLKWQGWKRIGDWKGWKALLFPHPLLVLVLTGLSGAGLVWVFLNGQDTAWFAYAIYVLAFYALVTLIALLIKVVPAMKRKAEHNPLVQKVTKDEELRFRAELYGEQFINFFYGITKTASGILEGSAWLGADGLYNLAQSLVQLYQILRRRKAATAIQQLKSYRQCGFMMIVVHLSMVGMVYQMTQMGRHEDYPGFQIFATAAFTFYKLINAVVDVAKDRKNKRPVDSAVRLLELSQALYNLFVLQVGLLWMFGGNDPVLEQRMNMLTGGVVCLMVLGMGVYMLWRADRDMKQLEERELG